MLHQAASRLRWASVQESGYQPTSSESPRPCPAKDNDRQGCNCDTTTCATVCRYATPRNSQTRFIWYANSNKSQDNPNQATDSPQKETKRGKGYYGYCSLPLVVADPVRRFSLPRSLCCSHRACWERIPCILTPPAQDTVVINCFCFVSIAP
jgi:hypothetical protein